MGNGFSITILGDIHGSFKPIRGLYNNNKEFYDANDRNILILLGDVGANFFFNYRDDEFKKKLGSYPFEYYCLRGNHEQRPSIIANDEEFGEGWNYIYEFEGWFWQEKKYPYIKYFVDEPAVYQIFDYKTLIIPGAFSVDKEYRLMKGWSWFEKEQLDVSEMDRGRALVKENNGKFDLVLSHTCPLIWEPRDLFLPSVDQSKVDKTMEQYLGEIEYGLSYIYWFFGHYHQTRINNNHMMLFNDYGYVLEYYNGKEDRILETGC